MSLDPKVIPELVELAKNLQLVGYDLGDYRAQNGMCGCLGPSKGNYLCPCNQYTVLEQNMVTVVAEFDEEQAKKIMLRRLVGALPG